VRCPGCGYDNIGGIDACEHCGMDLAGLDLPEAGSGFRGRMLSDRLADLALARAVEIDATATVHEAITAMRERKCGCVLVHREGRLAGIFNERHVLTRVVRRGVDPEATTIGEVMSPDPLRLSPADPPAHAVHCMVTHGFRHLAVVEEERVLGYVSVRVILDYIARLDASSGG
jgi:CBS domain-containing protein